MSKPESYGRNYALVTTAYWSFTLTDGALRMLVLLHFHRLGFSTVNLAFLFLLYEFCGIVTNLVGGWIASQLGLRFTLFSGLFLQILSLTMLSFSRPEWSLVVSVCYVMASQALSGIAKDLTKMSSKSAVKLLVNPDSENQQSTLFRWVAVLTGSKNALKGVGFFMGGFMLGSLGFRNSLLLMAGALLIVLVLSLALLKSDMGKTKAKIKFSQLFSKSRSINLLSLARVFLFGSRDVWFVVGLPIFLSTQLQWSFAAVGGFMALWVIGYGFVQAFAPGIVRRQRSTSDGMRAARFWIVALLCVSFAMALAIELDFHPRITVLIGLAVFGVVFALNSSIHSYLILAYTDEENVALNVGFYYMANACGRLAGTLLSGVSYLFGGLPACLWTSTAMVLLAALSTLAMTSTSTSAVEYAA
ncbi:MAG: organoarsenical effux MFS transporter ArsJ [Planctomycetales bacterium]|nr:organoarsenical effux MFS transporter ArsJ [Planctomycetales bacterium]